MKVELEKLFTEIIKSITSKNGENILNKISEVISDNLKVVNCSLMIF